MNTRVALLGLVVFGSCSRSSLEPPVLIRGATLRALVASLDGLETRLARDVEALGGFTTSSDRNDASLTVAFRVPVAKLDEAMRAIEALAQRVDDRQVRGDDFTEEYVDLEAQRANLTATRDRLLVLLEKSTRVEDALEVSRGLTEVQGQLEKVSGRRTYLQQAAALSTVTVTFHQERDWRPLEVGRSAVRGLRSVLQFLASALIVALVFSPLWAPLAWFLRRRVTP